MVAEENISLTSFSYLVFPKVPAYYTHGVTDPNLENRLWRKLSGGLVANNALAAQADGVPVKFGQGTFATPPQAAGYTELRVHPHLEYGRRYLLTFNFLDPSNAHGVLQIVGAGLFREYAIPEYGGAQSFGAGGEHSDALPIWTSNPNGGTVSVRFFPDGDPAGAADLGPFAQASWLQYEPSHLPVQVLSWIPYRARVNSPVGAWLETPRMYQTGYAARVDGAVAEVRKSPEDLVSVRVPAGRSEVTLKYYPPIGLEIIFWMSLAATLFFGMILCLGITPKFLPGGSRELK
jgi:hypothetical protein